jgi:hypothetical protein
MSLAHIHEQLRDVMNHRIQNGTMTCKLLSMKTGLKPSHLCNFLHGYRRLSLDSMSRVMKVQGLTVELVPISRVKEKA